MANLRDNELAIRDEVLAALERFDRTHRKRALWQRSVEIAIVLTLLATFILIWFESSKLGEERQQVVENRINSAWSNIESWSSFNSDHTSTNCASYSSTPSFSRSAVKREAQTPTIANGGLNSALGVLYRHNEGVDLRYLYMPGAYLMGLEIPEAIVEHARLWESDLSNARLGKAVLLYSDLHMSSLVGADLKEAYLSHSNLYGADLANADLRYARLEKAKLIKANMTNANLSGAHLFKADLSGAVLNQAILEKADLTQANLSNGNNLYGADFFKANLTGTIFSNANMDGIKLEKAILRGADLGGARNITSDQLRKAGAILCRTTMPNYSLSDCQNQ